MHSHSSGWCNGDNPFLRQGNTGCAQEACQKLKMTVLVSTRETWGDAVPTHKVQTQSPGLFQWREFASWAVWKKEYKSMYWCKIINRGYRQKMFVVFFSPEEKAGCFIPFSDMWQISFCKISLPGSPQWEKEVVILLKPFRFHSGMFQIFLILLSFSL